MVVVCAVTTCPRKKVTTNVSTRSQSIQFHRFPLKRNDLLQKWLNAMKAPDFKPTMNTYICSTHFKDSDYELKGSQRQLKPNAVPSIFIQKPNKRSKKEETVRQQQVESEESDTASKTDEVEYGEIEKLDEEVEYILDEEADEGVTLSFNSSEKEQKIIEVQSQLSGLLGSQGNNAPLLLIIGDDGQIKNSDFIFKKETDDEIEEKKPDIEMLENFETFNNEILVDNGNEVSEIPEFSEPIRKYSQTITKIVQTPQTDSKEQTEEVKILEEKLALSRKKVKRLHTRCTKMEKRVKELKVLLKMLILKRGKGVKNLSELFDEYSKNNDTEEVF